MVKYIPENHPGAGLSGYRNENNETVLENVGLAIDIGNSETKAVVVLKNNTPKGFRFIQIRLPNVFSRDSGVPLTHDAFTTGKSWRFRSVGKFLNPRNVKVDMSSADYRIKGENIFDAGDTVSINKEAGRTYRPAGSTRHKTRVDTTVLSLNLIFGEVYNSISEAYEIPLDELKIIFSYVRGMVPPEEFGDKTDPESGQNLLTNIIRSIDRIDFIHPHIQKTITYKDPDNAITVVREGAPGYFYARYGLTQQDSSSPLEVTLRKQYVDPQGDPNESILAIGASIIVDMGSGTTDLLLMHNGKIVEKQHRSVSEGGATVASRVKTLVGSKVDEVTEKNIIDGYATKGFNTRYDLSHYINRGRTQVVNNLINDIHKLISSAGLSIDDIRTILVIGGGAIPFTPTKKYESAEPLSSEVGKVKIQSVGEIFQNEIEDEAPYAKVIELPYEKNVERDSSGNVLYNGDGKPSEVKVTTDPRMMNVSGLATAITMLINKSLN